jgi:hypothetical protein
VSIPFKSESLMSMRWDGRTSLTVLKDAELREIADDAGRRERRLVVRRRWWWRELRYGVEVELAYRALSARPEASPPTDEQRRILEVLRVSPWSHNRTLADEVALDSVAYAAAVRDALNRGWIRSDVGGIGGYYARPVGSTELTPEGRKQLAEQ